MSGFVTESLRAVAAGQALSSEQAEAFMNLLMSGEITPIQTAGMLAAMTVRGETVEEIVGFTRAMRKHAVHIDAPADVVDTCGTGGDGLDTFNISTASAIVAAAAGVPIAKHGNRAVSSRSGSADVLLSLGARIDLGPYQAASCLRETNLCFMFAPNFHPAMKHAAEPRKQLGFRTIFNILGPLTNPANARRQVLGVFRPDLVGKVAEALLALGSEHALVVHGAGGMDEISLQGETLVAEVRDGRVRTYNIQPEQMGLSSAPVSAVVGGDADHNAQLIRRVLAGVRGPHRDIVLLNAGAVLYVGGRVGSIAEGVKLAASVVDSGAARATLDAFVAATHDCAQAEVAQ
ncbi:MAG: anthranilate phosphoribosyltransferase [Alicyclobacillus sp.]|nr:anthranilate phosphoribosyltransferase [Alicyclobacillus sp.]